MSERITLEELQDNLQQRTEEQESALESLKSMFSDAGFELSEEKNTIDFTDTHKDLKALFSVDNTTFKYSCYITVDDVSDKSYNFALKGNIDGIEDAAKKFLAEYSDLTTLDIEEPVEDAEDISTEDDIPEDEVPE